MILLVNMIPNSLSGETNQDSEPTIAVNPANPLQIVGSAFTPDPAGGNTAPLYISNDGGNTWMLNSIVPSETLTADITVAFAGTTSNLYAGIIPQPIVKNTPGMRILRANNFQSQAPMTVLVDRTGQGVDQPYIQATSVAGVDHVYVGDNDFNASPQTSTVDFSTDASNDAGNFQKTVIEARGTGTAGQDGPSIRPAISSDGQRVYAAFLGWRASAQLITADVVVVRDDNGASGVTPFAALVDADGNQGVRVVQGITFDFNGFLGQQRVGGDVSIAVDPIDSNSVFIAYATLDAGNYNLHVRSSVDGGATWSTADLLTIVNATNPALAINAKRNVGFLYQQLVGQDGHATWVTHLQRTADTVHWADLVLASVPASNPAKQFDPYIGDYDHLLAVGPDFFGIFSASNFPSKANFPNGVVYQRNLDFNSQTLLDVDNRTPVDVSIDPFFFKVTE